LSPKKALIFSRPRFSVARTHIFREQYMCVPDLERESSRHSVHTHRALSQKLVMIYSAKEGLPRLSLLQIP
jgi:hypothetical protein